MFRSGSRSSGDEVQFLYERQNTLPCQICNLDLLQLTEDKRNLHYDKHLSKKPEGPSDSASSSRSSGPEAGPSTTKSPLKPQSKNAFPSASFSPMKRKRNDSVPKETFWHSKRLDPPPHNFTPGLIPVIKKALLKAHTKNGIEKAYLCSDVAVHVGTEPWDRGWGCGYRNFLMSCSALIGQELQPLYFPLLDDPLPPGVRNLQQWIEDAWSQGFDVEGAQQLKHKLVETSKWIGTAELYVAFSFRGIPASLVDFDLSKRGTAALVQWIVDYFTQYTPKQTDINEALRAASPVVVTDKLPIVLQHAGHSRTVIGYERHQGKITLLMFDPGRRVPQDIREAALATMPPMASLSNIPSASRQRKLSPRKVIKRILHPHSSSANGPSEKKAKRIRAGEEVIVIDSDDDEPATGYKQANDPPELNPSKVLSAFRVNQSNLAKKDKYQILYFPMTAPLTAQERLERKVVTSKKIS